jgi:hypothetical protein
MTTPAPTTAQQAPPKPSYNPLNEAVNEKSYSTSGPGGLSQNDLLTDIPEPTFTPPPLDINDIPRKEGTTGSQQQQAKPKQPFNPALNELSESERNSSAAQMAAFVMTMYEKGHEFANHQLKIPEKKIQKMQMEGTVDLTVAVPYEIGKFVQLDEFINEYNAQASDVLIVEEEFKKSVMPPLTRVLAKRGHGMTDEQYLIFMFGQDIAVKGFKFAQMKAQTKSILNFAVEQTAAARQRPVQPIMQPINSPQQPTYEQQAPVVQQQGPAPVVPMQDRIMQQHQGAVNPAGNAAITDFGDPGKLHTMDEIYEQELKEKKKKESIQRRLANNPPTGNKRVSRKGRVPGAIPNGISNKGKGGRKPGRPKGTKKKVVTTPGIPS